MKTWTQWNDHEPEFLQIDPVATKVAKTTATSSTPSTSPPAGPRQSRCGPTGERIFAAGLDGLWLRFPFHIGGIHSDNRNEFKNHHLARWCHTRQITFTRGRASNKNDQAHVGQKNWSLVRRSVDYFRYHTRRELDLLNQLWPLVSLQVNLFLPAKLVSKTPAGAIVGSKHDTATTPRYAVF